MSNLIAGVKNCIVLSLSTTTEKTILWRPRAAPELINSFRLVRLEAHNPSASAHATQSPLPTQTILCPSPSHRLAVLESVTSRTRRHPSGKFPGSYRHIPAPRSYLVYTASFDHRSDGRSVTLIKTTNGIPSGRRGCPLATRVWQI